MPRACRAGGSLQRYMQIKANPHMHDGGGLPEPLGLGLGLGLGSEKSR
jgi:hypothetical protein